ncbi:MAG: hypothetical protein H6855_06600 [Rhodospirillales bacterium]|nr:hypothetical protein [Rhodospirillales bacterium]MCB9965733.1 hypothetical protein [Rhodospirillales bacterium]MCB9979661.1 hypothetical protein [Rhodospirillales bacterium]
MAIYPFCRSSAHLPARFLAIPAVLVLACFSGAGAPPASAQTTPQMTPKEVCNVIPEAIERLYAPRSGAYSLWDLYDQTAGHDERFQDVLLLNDTEEVIVAGWTAPTPSAGPRTPLLKKMTRRGRTLWMWPDPKKKDLVPQGLSIRNVLSSGTTLIAVGQIYKGDSPHALWFGTFDSEGRKLSEQTLKQAEVTWTLGGITPARPRQGEKQAWFLAVTETSQEAVYTRFIELAPDFKKRQERAFMPGPSNHIYDVARLDDPSGRTFYLAVGDTESATGQVSGLLVKLDEQLNIVWQRTYSRGSGLRFQTLSVDRTGQILALGDARPINTEAPSAAVLMYLDAADGSELWQRYYMRDDMAYQGQSVIVSPEGRISILLAGTNATNPKFQDHGRLLTISPRGQILSDRSYSAGIGVMLTGLKPGPHQEPVLFGQATTREPDPDHPKTDKMIVKKGWLVVAEPQDDYKDPCKNDNRPF